MALGGVESTLTTIAACGGVGAFVDFWIGKGGEKRVRDWLETWWLRFSYVNVRNFGREEANFAVTVLNRLFGREPFSQRHLIATVVTLTVASAPPVIATTVLAFRHNVRINWYPSPDLDGMTISIAAIFFLVSITLTIVAAEKGTRLIGRYPKAGFLFLLAALAFQYIIFVIWAPAAFFVRTMIAVTILETKMLPLPSSPNEFFMTLISIVEIVEHELGDLSNGLARYWSLDYVPSIRSDMAYISLDSASPNFSWSTSLIGFVGSLGRIVLTFVFILLFSIKPLHTTLSTLWLRVVESDKPIFTLLFGGGAAAAKAVEWVIQTL
jgi:hypothetical protein